MDFKISQRANAIDASGIRKVFDLAATLKNPVNLSIGQPDFDIPASVKAEGVAAIEEGFNRYTQTQGIPELNEAIRRDLEKRYNYKPEATMVSSGVSGALLLLMLAIVEEGDEVAFADPYFVMYKHLVNLVNAKPLPISTYPDFLFSPDRIRKSITKNTKVLLINSPANPTGKVIPAEVLQEIADIAREHSLIVISDEIYSTFSYDQPFHSMGTYYPEGTVVVNGFSKSVAMTGWRIGYAAGPAKIIEQMTKLQQYTFVCAPSFAQRAAVKALSMENEYLADYSKRRDLIYEGLQEAGYKVNRPEGAFYIFPECPEDEDSFIKKAIDNNLLIIPGSVFSEQKGYFRISFAATMETLKEGLDILKKIR